MPLPVTPCSSTSSPGRVSQRMLCRASPLLVEQVGDVREGGAGLQAGRLRRGGRGDAVVRLAGRQRRRRRHVEGRRRLRGHERAALQEPAQARRGESARGAELALVELPGLVDELQRRALARAEPGRRLRAPAQRAARRRDADDVHAVRHAQPALAPVPLRVRGERAGLQPDAVADRAAGSPPPPRPQRRRRVSAYRRSILSAPVGRAHERQRGRERREVVLLDAARDVEQLRGDGRDAQDVPQRQRRVLRAPSARGPRGRPR